MHETESQVIEAVRDGNKYSDEISDAVGRHKNHMVKVLKDMTADGDEYTEQNAPLTRVRKSNGFEYEINPSWERANRRAEAAQNATAAPADADDDEHGDAGMYVDRDYDWDSPQYAPSNVSYVSANGEKKRIMAKVAGRHRHGMAPRATIGGPTGCGKTTLAEDVAHTSEAVWFEIQMFPDMSSADLLGSPSIDDETGATEWVDGPLTKALLASQERLTVLLVDEYNRAPARAVNVMFSALDHRCRVTLDGPRGGEVIQGNPENLVVFATKNEGTEYAGIHNTDAAADRRFAKSQYDVDYIGLTDPTREADLISGRTGIAAALAEDMVTDVANVVRNRAKDTTNHNIDRAIPTAALIHWAETALDYNDAGIEEPLLASGMDTIVTPIFGGSDTSAGTTVQEMIGSKFRDAPVTEEEYVDHTDDERVYCTNCDFEVSQARAEAEYGDDLLVDRECPECESGFVRTYERN